MEDHVRQPTAAHWSDAVGFRVLFVTAILLGVLFRFSGLGNKLYSHDEALASLRAAGYSSDEAWASLWDSHDKSIQEVRQFLVPSDQKTIMDTLSVTALHGPHQAPLFYMLAHYWMRLLGSSPADMRALAAVLGLLAIPALYWLAWELFRERGPTQLAVIFFALSPYHILYAQDARPYSLWTLTTLLASATLLRTIRRNARSGWLIYTLAVILGIYSHQLFLLVLLIHGVYLIGLYFAERTHHFRGYVVACLLALLAYLPWLVFVLDRWNLIAGQMGWVTIQFPPHVYLQRLVIILCSPFLDFDLESGKLIFYFLRALVSLFMAFAFLTIATRRSGKEWLLPVLMYSITIGVFFVPDILTGGIRTISGRYLVPAQIAILLITAHFLARKLDPAEVNRQRVWRLLVAALLALGILSNVNSMVAETWWNKMLGRIQPDFVHQLDHNETLLLVSGHYPTNLGDVLLLTLELDSDVHFRLVRDAEDVDFSGNYANIYWLPHSRFSMQEVIQREGVRVKEILPGVLWQIDPTE